MTPIDLEVGLASALDAILADRLVILCGAGLSMSPPSNLPSAADLAMKAKRKYDAEIGSGRPPLSADIEEQAEFFFGRDELATVYLSRLIDRHSFSAPPNPGHEGIADLLLTGAARLAVSANVDAIIEAAGSQIYGSVTRGVDRDGILAVRGATSPLLKIHGCWESDRTNTVWCKSQISVEPVMSRIRASDEMLRHELRNRDILVVGFWTDWDYLNETLESSLGQVNPSRVIVVNPSDTADLVGKAPFLTALGAGAGVQFVHVKSKGDTFIESLRRVFSQSYIRQLLHAGVDSFDHHYGRPPTAAAIDLAMTDVSDLWSMRRDLEGCLPGRPAITRVPHLEPMLGMTIIQLKERGAISAGPYWELGGERIRVVRAANTSLPLVTNEYARETAPVVAPTITIAVGAEPSVLPGHIVRSASPASIARGPRGRWLTRQDAVTELGL